MNLPNLYATKAEKYARYRWDYAPEALKTLMATIQPSPSAVVADIGAGTGILTRHLVGSFQQVFAIEPNQEMRREAQKALAASTNCEVLAASAEQIPLPVHSVDLITVAQAIHWFDPQPTRREFLRILKPGGWLALLRNYSTTDELDAVLATVFTPENGVLPVHPAPAAYQKPTSYYFGGNHYQKWTFPFTIYQDWETFIGSICSASFMPDESHSTFPAFEQAVRALFERYCPNGRRDVHGETELILGQPNFGGIA